jgi:hypothetical protein
MLIDRFLPSYDVTEVQQVQVNAPPDVTYRAIRKADLRDPLVNGLFALREMPDRIARRLHHQPPRRALEVVSFEALATPEMGWMPLGEEPGVEFVVGAVGRFWKRDYGWRPVSPDQFAGFDEPGYAKLAVSFRVRPSEASRTVLRYEARTATTDASARKRLRGYWRIIGPGVTLLMHRALLRIRAEAERARRDHPVSV